jgi:hypothetical protein
VTLRASVVAFQTVAGQTRYLNTDLDVISERDPASLVDALDKRFVSLIGEVRKELDGYHAIFETHVSDDEPETTVLALLEAVEGLDGEARETWQACSARELHLGYDCGDEPKSYSQAISSATLTRAVAAGMSLRITLYPADPS